MPLQDAIANSDPSQESTGGAVVAKATKTKGKKRTAKKRAARKKAAVKKTATSRAKTASASTARKSARLRRYTPQERQHILDVAKREGLTGAKVAERFGVSTLSYYTWRKKAGKATVPRRGRPPGRRAGTASPDLASALREEIRAQIRRKLPEIIAAEIAGYLK